MLYLRGCLRLSLQHRWFLIDYIKYYRFSIQEKYLFNANIITKIENKLWSENKSNLAIFAYFLSEGNIEVRAGAEVQVCVRAGWSCRIRSPRAHMTARGQLRGVLDRKNILWACVFVRRQPRKKLQHTLTHTHARTHAQTPLCSLCLHV